MAYKNFQGNVMDYKEIYESWLNDERLCGEAKAELEAVKDNKEEIEKAKAQDDKILDFMLLIYKYSNFEELTPEILRSFIDKVIVHEKTKVNGHYRQTVEII